MNSTMVADEYSKESFLWLFQSIWLRAMRGRPPRSIVADQDLPIKQALSRVFPGAHHRYSAWQIRETERVNLRPFPSEFEYEYEKCLYQTQTVVEFDSVWNTLVDKYGLRDNVWLREVYEHRENWMKEPVEEQCRRLYTLTVFRIFQNELVQSYNYLCLKTHEEGAVSRFWVRKESEKHAVTFSAELPSRYILHIWTKNTEFGFVRVVESVVSSRDLKALMVWSLREAASKYIEFGTSSLEKYKLAYEIMREGGKKLCCQR
ncbi:hypothetical protein YC2023_119375 [Brassica napus]